MYRLTFNNLNWGYHTFTGDEAWEFEFRYPPISNLVDQPCIANWNPLPGGYFEDTDPDDITFGCHDPQDIDPIDEYYTGYMNFTPKSTQPASFSMELESEYGLDFWTWIDPYPQDYESLGYIAKGSTVSW
jgi:hypothetical protein